MSAMRRVAVLTEAEAFTARASLTVLAAGDPTRFKTLSMSLNTTRWFTAMDNALAKLSAGPVRDPVVLVLTRAEGHALSIAASNITDWPDALESQFSHHAAREAAQRAARKLRQALQPGGGTP